METLYTPLDNKSIRANARKMMRGRLWYYWSMSLVIYLVTYLLSLIPSIFFSDASTLETLLSGPAESIPREVDYSNTIISEAITLALSIFTIPMYFGLYRNINLLARGADENRWKVLFSNYKSVKKFFKTIGLTFLSVIICLLFTALLIIPGIIKALSYTLAPYILYDEPNLSIVETLKKSSQMMKGYKGRLFTMYLTFFLWMIVGALTLGILYIWIYPHFSASIALFYDEIRRAYYGGDDPARPHEEKTILGSIFH